MQKSFGIIGFEGNFLHLDGDLRGVLSFQKKKVHMKEDGDIYQEMCN